MDDVDMISTPSKATESKMPVAHPSLFFVILDDNLQTDPDIQSLISFTRGSVIPTSQFIAATANSTSCDNNRERQTIILTNNFDNPIVSKFRKAFSVLAPPALKHFAPTLKDDPLAKCSSKGRHKSPAALYNLSMKNVICVMSGFKSRDDDVLDELQNLVHWIQWMGGQARDRFPKNGSEDRATHVIASSVQCDKYGLAVSMGIPVLKPEWIRYAWEHRNDSVDLTSDDLIAQFRLKTFAGLRIFFHGFQNEEAANMKNTVEQYGGEVATQPEDASYIVLQDLKGGSWQVTAVENPSPDDPPSVKITFQKEFEESNDSDLDISEPLYFLQKPDGAVLKVDWFWSSVQIQSCAHPAGYSYSYGGTLGVSLKSAERKRKNPASSKRTPRTSRPRLSPLTEVTGSRGRNASFDMSEDDTLSSPLPCSLTSSPTVRRHCAQEIYVTEGNYCSLLEGILSIMEKSIDPHQQAGALLPSPAADQMKDYIDKIGDILKIHRRILHQLDTIISNWKENCEIGNIFTKECENLKEAYPPFVNTQPKFLSLISEWENQYMRFQAHLKLSQKAREYGREHLKDLLIRPVQRLPSVLLQIKRLLHETRKADRSLSDIGHLERAAHDIDKVCLTIDSGKRANDLIESIDGAPEELSEHSMSYICHIECVELGKGQYRKPGVPIMFILMQNSLEVAKIREDQSHSVSFGESKGRLKHIRLLKLSDIKHVYDVVETEDVKGAFALEGLLSDSCERVPFKFAEQREPRAKKDFLAKLASQICISTCTASLDEIVSKVTAPVLGIKSAGTPNGKMGRRSTNVINALHRVASIGKSSGKKVMKRAISSVMNLSPMSGKGDNGSDKEVSSMTVSRVKL